VNGAKCGRDKNLRYRDWNIGFDTRYYDRQKMITTSTFLSQSLWPRASKLIVCKVSCMSKNISKLLGRKGLADNLFEKIKVGGETAALADHFLVGKSTIEGSESFYEFLDAKHQGKAAWVCEGTACMCSGNMEETRASLASQLGEDKVGSMICLGHCYEANALHYAGQNFSGKDVNRPLSDLLKGGSHTEKSSRDQSGMNVRCVSRTQFLTGQDFDSLEQFSDALSTLFSRTTLDSLTEIKKSGLRGRGGAGFPTGIKWESCLLVESDIKYVVCNADEGDPGAFSDRYLMEQQAQRVIFGMLVAGWIIGSKEGVIYIRAEYPDSIRIILDTLSALRHGGLLGLNILNSGFDFDIKVVKGAGAYICGEETALIASIEGRRPEVDVRPPFPTNEGLYKKPTVLNNVESFAAIEQILVRGGDAYAAMGSAASCGTKLVSLDAGFVNPGLLEVEMGMPLSALIHTHGGGFKQETKALHIGGPLGGLVPVSKIETLTLDYETFDNAGFLLGHASIVCVPETFPMVKFLAHLFEFTAAESCGKCFPCRIGSVRGKEMFTAAITEKRLMDRDLLNDLLDTLEQGSLCALGGGLPLPIKNALQYFEAELSAYFQPVQERISLRDLS